MVVFEITVNGQRRFVGEGVRAITVVADHVARRDADRVSVHVGIGDPGEREVQYLGSDFGPGDEVSIRVLGEEEAEDAEATAPERCSFCGTDVYHILSLVRGSRVGICDGCLRAFDTVVRQGAALPLGASLQHETDLRCGFCSKAPPEVPGLVVRNGAGICPECLHTCVDLVSGPGEG